MTRGPARASASGQSASDHAARYERLRTYVRARHAPMSRDGLVVLLRQGVAAWMETWSRLATPPVPPVRTERQRSLPLPDEASAEVVRILAAMALGHIREVQA